MYTVTKYPHGTLSWADLISTDQAKAKTFYAELMGWDTEDTPMGPGQMYTFFKVDGHRVAAVGPMQQPMLDQGVPSFWANYITVDDVDALVDKVTEYGGTVVAPPFDVFEDGRMMTIQDPGGATVALWQAKNSIGAGLVNTTGAMVWNELNTRHPQAAQEFYTKLLGWTFDHDATINYTMILNNGRYNGGVITMNDDWAGMPSSWMVYFNVADVDAAVAKVPALGGKAVTPVLESPAGRFAVISDPTGGHFTVMQAGNVDTWLEHTTTS